MQVPHVDEIEQKELWSPGDDRIDDEFQFAGTHQTAHQCGAIDCLRHSVRGTDAAGDQAGAREPWSRPCDRNTHAQ